ncbi:MAG: RNA-metabolising metallo-beta-lactamase [Parcubacteria group bacterium GW2011_GWF2_44_8b]|nr:MAG: RNA-metabolising metallo-beta-lactamase [Parcubacteria group bacterium GW2011_GWC1_43_30]KKT80720.1 MAG: RNA-metabolising metallo-beta-lactamase [Parcubacteria group bacterium GW2011_GWF2_44_8b]KKT85663.1 MAG: RNA-metabolising metallo-beta-lactamase [Parcubacteria group bacterium GW2011_GWD1_44_9]
MNNTFTASSRHKSLRRRSNAPMVAKKPHDIIPPIGDSIRIIPLGGVEEIGRNMTVIEFGEDIIVCDAGIQFTDHETPGIDYILPNIKYLEERKDKIRALVITHGHLDHIGAIPYVIDRLGNPPIYTREFGALMIQKRQVEFPHLAPLNIKIVDANDKSLPLTANLKIRFFGLTHSIPESTGIIIETPYGDIVNTGDVRVENENGVPAEKEFEQYKIFKDRNVLLFTMDSTGIEKPGWSPSEASILKNIDSIVASAPGRIILATFSSQIERIIEFINMARRYGRNVLIEGRSMKANVEIIKHLNLVDTSIVIPIEDITKYPPNKIMIIATGAQGEEFAALARISNKTHKFVRLERSDTIVLSSSIIPGNDQAVEKLKDNLYRNDSKIITYLDSNVHTSGHGKRDELKWLHQQIPYKYFMPVHGNHFRLKMHAELAFELGCPRENIIVPDNGSIIEIQDKGAKFVKLREKAPSEDMVVEGLSIGDLSEVVIRDRKMLAADGIFVVIALVNVRTGHLKKSPDIIARGFVYLRESQELLSEARSIIRRSIEGTTVGMNPINFDYTKNAVTEDVSRFLFQRTAKKPIVIPVILGV